MQKFLCPNQIQFWANQDESLSLITSGHSLCLELLRLAGVAALFPSGHSLVQCIPTSSLPQPAPGPLPSPAHDSVPALVDPPACLSHTRPRALWVLPMALLFKAVFWTEHRVNAESCTWTHSWRSCMGQAHCLAWLCTPHGPGTQWSEARKWKLLSRVQLFATPWTIQSMEFSRPEYWSGEPFPSPGDLPNPGINPRS